MDLPSAFSAINQDDLNNIDVENAIDGNANSGDGADPDAHADNSGDDDSDNNDDVVQGPAHYNAIMIIPT